MSRLSKKRLFAVGIFLCSLVTIGTFMLQRRTPYPPDEDQATSRGRAGGLQKKGRFLVDTPGCKIPDVDPFDSSIRHLIMKSNELHCNGTPAITYVEKDMLRINRTALRLHYREELENCLYQSIHRSPEPTDDLYFYGNESRLFQTDVHIPEDFIRVACYGSQGSLLYTNFHALIHRKRDVERRCRTRTKQSHGRDKRRLNVIIVGVDSVSRLNLVRQMPKSRRFLLQNLSAVELLGYNKVADNTYVNLVPMFAGKYVHELPWEESMNTPFDRYNFLWKNFSESGFRTLYAEDAPKIAIFNYAKEGFHRPPADYYLRPFSLAMEDHGAVWNSNHDCVGSRLETQVVLDYLLAFLREFKSDSYFAFSFITRLTHDGVNKVGAADAPYYSFLSSLHKEGHLENSVLIFFSDHGMRFGSIRETYIGKLEERLPFLLLVFPAWFKKKHPKLHRNLLTNRRRLTTPFDIYETLKDVLRMEETGSKSTPARVTQRGISLFSEVPPQRTCDHASISEHWCTCHVHEKVSPGSAVVISSAQFVISEINKIIARHRGLCAELFLKHIVDARKLVSSKEEAMQVPAPDRGSASRPTDYMLTLRTRPGDALFEATVRVRPDSFSIIGDLSRINAYGDSGACIQVHSHMKFCYCQ